MGTQTDKCTKKKEYLDIIDSFLTFITPIDQDRNAEYFRSNYIQPSYSQNQSQS